MKILTHSRSEQGNTLLTVVIIGAIMFITTLSMLSTSSGTLTSAYSRVDWNKAFFIAENALVWASQKSFDSLPAAGSTNTYSTANGTMPWTAIISSTNAGDRTVKNAWVKVVQPSGMAANVLYITSSAKVNNKVRTLSAIVTIRPSSQVFDYEYFLNNWGWWWGNTITGNGGQRSNWDFDFRYSPTVNGLIYAANEVDENESPIQSYSTPPFNGLAGQDATNLVHSGAPRVVMPNLLNFTNYINTALANTASNGLWIGSTQVVYGVVTNSSTPNPGGKSGNLSPQTGLYVVGTAANPITVKGTVVIPGDLVIQGTVTGQGTLYVGGNLYIANDINYKNGPDFSALPETQTSATRDAWVANSQNNDLVAYAVRGSILAGDVTDPDWVNYCLNYPVSGLANVGSEATLGQDGIAGTGDDGIAYSHTVGGVTVNDASYDADGDGIIDANNYNYNTDINMTSTRAANILNYPKDGHGNPVSYSNVATDNMGTLNGIFYTDHAAAMRLANNNATINGVIVSRNEQIIFQQYLNLVYDSRVNSRYNTNPNHFINLGLPWGKPLSVVNFTELTPNSSGL